MSLIIHAGARLVDYDELRQVDTPKATASHVPLPHHELVNMVRYALGYHQHEIIEEHHAIMPDGQRYFGVMSLRSPYGDYVDTLGLRNSHDKSWPVGLAFGSRVLVCDNTAFNGETVVKRKHTANARRDLPGIVMEIVEPLQQKRIAQAHQMDAYRGRPMLEPEVHDCIMRFYKRGAINQGRIPDVLEAYERPPHDWGPESAWRLFNAATYALRGRVAENPQATQTIHAILDGYCEEVETRQLTLV